MTDYMNIYSEYLTLAIYSLKEKDYMKAEECIKQAMYINPHSSVIHNLYGILEEYLKDYNLARKHYRASYALDPTYNPAIRNLERISMLYLHDSSKQIDFGDKQEEDKPNPYVIL